MRNIVIEQAPPQASKEQVCRHIAQGNQALHAVCLRIHDYEPPHTCATV